MHPADIHAAMVKAGTSQSALARGFTNRHGKPLTAAAVHQVVHGRSHSERIALRISELTGLPVGELWPGKYPQLEARQVGRSRRASSRTPTRTKP